MEFLALIPARYDSSRFPGKPLALIGGKPMIQHVYERASAIFQHCYAATDDRRIADAVEAFGGRVVMTGGHHRSGTDRCAEALHIVESQTGRTFDVVLNIQGDEPFIDTMHLHALTEVFDDPQTSIGTLVRRFARGEDIDDPNTPKVVFSRDGSALYFSRSRIPYIREKGNETDGNVAYYKHIGLYAYRSAALDRIACMPQSDLEKAESLEQLRWLENGLKIKVAEVSGDTLAVDTPEDLIKVNEYYMSRIK